MVRARVAPQKSHKKVSWEKELSLLRAKIDVLGQQITRLNKSVLFHQEKLRENEDALSSKQAEHAQLEVAFRDLTAKGSTPTPSQVRSPAQSDSEGEEGEGGEEEGDPDVSMEQDSGGSGADGNAARLVAGTVEKGGVLGKRMC